MQGSKLSMEKISPSKSQLYVRLVRCPRCARLLAEPTDVPLYGCGGCGTLLQAKHYKNESEKRTTSDHSNDVQNDESKHDPHAGDGDADRSSPQHSQEHNIGIDQNVAQSGKLDLQLEVSSSSEEVSSSNQAQAQPQSALSSQDTNETSYSNELARLTLEDPSSSLEQDEMVAKEQFEPTDSSSQATTTTASNQEIDVQVLQIESGDDANEVNSLNKEEMQLVAALEEENTIGSLNSDKIEETRDLHKSRTRKSSAYEGSVSSYEAEYPISEDSQSEEYYRGWKNKHYLTTQRTLPMLHVIEMPPQHTTHVPTKGRRAQLSSLYEPSSFSTNMDGRMFPVHPYYDSSQETNPHVFTESEYSEDQEMSRFHLRRKSQNARRILPMVGAAPFVTCYECLELLELPLEFIVLKTRRRSYRVKCSTCSSNLEFAVIDEKGCQRQLVPCISESRDQDGEIEHAQDKGKSKMVENQSHEEVKRSGLSLHRLMGYATPSAIFDGYD